MTENSPTDAADSAVDTSADTETATGVPDDGVVTTLTDPESLRDRDDVAFLDETHDEDREFYDADVAGRAVVGLTNDDGEVLLLEHPEQPPILPMCTVDHGDDWVAVGRGTVDDVRALSIELREIERVRTLTYADDDGEEQTNHYVVFRAAVAPDGTLPADPAVDDPDWTAGWYDAVPEGATDELAEDIETFLE